MCIPNSKEVETAPKTVKVGDQECAVETLRSWVNGRMAGIRQAIRSEFPPENAEWFDVADEIRHANLQGRLVELSIIREKINDGRIQEIG